MSVTKKGRRPVKVLMAFALLGLMAWAVVPRALTVYDLSQKKAELELRKSLLSTRNQQLQGEKASLNSPETMERIARERLGMLKDGERYLVQKQGDK